MRQITVRGSWSRLAARTAVVFAFLGYLGNAVKADIFVSDGSVKRFADDGTPKPFLDSNGNPFTILGGEGIVCVTVGGVPKIFVADNSRNITVYDLAGGTHAIFATLAGSVGALSLSSDGLLLYAGVYGAGEIVALDATQPSVGTTTLYSYVFDNHDHLNLPDASHDVRVGPDGLVYATYFHHNSGASNTGVLRFTRQLVPDPTLTPLGQFITPSAADSKGLFAPAGMTFDNLGNLWVANFANAACPTNPADLTTSCSRVNEYSSTGVFIRTFPFPAHGAPFGLALGPDNNIYVAQYLAGTVGKINVATTTSCATGCDFINTGLSLPKYLSFTEIDCKVSGSGILEVCKSSSTTNPVTGIFNFTIPGSAFSTSNNPLLVPVGECSGPITVSVPIPPGTVTITELPKQGVGVSAITAYGFSPPPASQVVPRLQSFDLSNRTATVIVVQPSTPSDTSTETLVNFVNYQAPPGQLKICKIAGDQSVAVGTPFTFLAKSTTDMSPPSPKIVEAGPASEGGFCVVYDTYPVGTSVIIAEFAPGYKVTCVTLNGKPIDGNGAPTANCTPIANGNVPVTTGPGFTEVAFTNTKSAGGSASLDIVNYYLVSQQAAGGTQSYMTYRADLMNTGTDLDALTATLTSLDPSSVQVAPGQGTLNFESAPANSRVTSSNTFTILTDVTVPVDFSKKLEWTFQASSNHHGRPSRR